MKKITAIVLTVLLACSMITGCGNDTQDTVSEVVSMAVLNGPTGMATVKMLDMEDKYDITTYQAPTDITAKVINGEVDVAAVPSNMAAVLYNRTEGQIVALTPIAMGMLQILGNGAEAASINDVSDLEGKTIVASGQGGTPEYVLKKILEEAGLTIYDDVQVEWLANHSDVNTRLLSQEGTIAMIPEPFVSTALSAAETNGVQVESLFDLGQLWEEATGEDLPMGVLIAQKDFVEERPDDVKVLLSDLKDSVDFVNDSPSEAAKLIVEKGFIGDEAIAEAAIPNCGISCFTGSADSETGINILKAFNQTMFEMDPASIGGAMPDEDLYYKQQ